MSEWHEFLSWEQRMTRRGSGLTRDQLIGARLYHDWLNRMKRPVFIPAPRPPVDARAYTTRTHDL